MHIAAMTLPWAFLEAIAAAQSDLLECTVYVHFVVEDKYSAPSLATKQIRPAVIVIVSSGYR